MTQRTAAREPVADRVLRTLNRPSVRRSLLFGAACALAFALEQWAEEAMHDPSSETSRSLFDVRGAYEYLVTEWPRRLVPRYTALVYMNTEEDATARGLAYNLCAQRGHIAKLVTALAAHDPAVIVVDKFFTDDGCPQNDRNTSALRDAIAGVAARIPVVVGLRIKEGERSKALPDAPYTVTTPLEFPPAPRLTEAIVNIDADSRRLAFSWPASVRGGPGERRETLALVAAKAYDAQLENKYPRLAAFVNDRVTPFTSMIALEDFTVFQSGDFICEAARSVESEPSCAGRKLRADLDYVRGRIVMFGQVSPDIDWHSTVIGRVPGVVVQANYVEAILDERYFRPAHPAVNYVVGFAFFVAIEFALRRRTALGCLAGIVASVLVLLLALYLTARHLSYFMNPVAVSALVLLLKLIAWLSERIVAVGGRRSHAR